MADFSALVNELKQNNQAEETRDQRRLNQATAHNQDQSMRFDKLASILSGKSDETKDALDGVAESTEAGQLTPTQEKEKDQQQKSIFAKLGEKFDGMKDATLGFFKKYGGAAKDFGLKTLKGFAFGLFLIGVLKFLQSDLFKTLLDKVQDFLGYFDNFGAKLNAFLQDPSFSSLVDLFMASGPIALAITALIALFNPFGTLKVLTTLATSFVGLFLKDGLVTKGVRGIKNKLGKKGLFSTLSNGVTSMIDGFKNLGTRASGLGTKIGNVLKQGASAGARGASAGGKLLASGAKGFAKTALGALRFAGPAGLIATAALTVGSGVMAGIDAYKKTGEVGTAIKEGFAGALSSLTLGFVSQESISEGMTKIGDSVSSAYNKAKDGLVSGFNSVKDGITKVVNDPEGAFNAVSGKLSELTGLDLPNFDESKKAIADMADRLKTGFEDFTGIKLPTSLDEAKTRLTEGLSSLGDSLSKKFSSLKEGVGGFFSKMFGGDEEGDPNTQLTETVKLKQEEINSLNQKLADASKMSIANQTEIAELREQIVNLSKQLETQQSGANVTTVNAPSQMVNNTQGTTVMATMIDNGSQPAGVGATA